MTEKHEAQVGPVMLFSANREDVAAFYADVLGLAADDGADATWMDAANAKVVVHDESDPKTPSEVRTQRGFVVWFGVTDVRAAYEKAKNTGSAVGEFHGDFFFAKDPDGRYIGVYTLEDHHGHDHDH
ncbi:MAG TPA: VOC family protein [Methylomirabilota bacterium]|nr:VOC family protein [Methylomirabilota bacterium]